MNFSITHSVRSLAFLLTSLLAISGCSNQQAAKDLATTTSLNTAILSSQLQKFGKQHQQLTQARVDQIALLRYRIHETRIRNELDIALMEASGNRSGLQTYDELQEWLERVDQILQQENDITHIKQTLAADISPLATKSRELTQVAKKLAELAKDKKLTVRAKFYADFIQQLSKDVKEGLKDNDTPDAGINPITTPATLNTVMFNAQ
ncbi:hypothetical protein R50073_07810 [Maricurvus nonylphenolicus]|uniref:hypothetical protein n=1 Tax=Maricurvus nonylphenolicus TaxID=1008307 RepID=UPI0036F3BBD7